MRLTENALWMGYAATLNTASSLSLIISNDRKRVESQMSSCHSGDLLSRSFGWPETPYETEGGGGGQTPQIYPSSCKHSYTDIRISYYFIFSEQTNHNLFSTKTTTILYYGHVFRSRAKYASHWFVRSFCHSVIQRYHNGFLALNIYKYIEKNLYIFPTLSSSQYKSSWCPHDDTW